METALYQKLKTVNKICATVSGIILMFVTFSIFVDVVLRYFFNSPSTWVTEVSTYLFLYLIFLGTAYALQEGLHIRVTFLLGVFGPRSRRLLALATSIFAMVYTVTLLWQTSIMTWTAFKENWTTPTMLNVPYAYVYVVMVVGSFLLFLTFLLKCIVEFAKLNDHSNHK